MIKLTGIIENVFDGMTVFRGYATLRTLMKLSKVGIYQRKEDSERLPKIEQFLKDSPFKFFPELIFGWQIEDETALPKIKGEQESGTITLTNNLKIKKAKFKFQYALGEDPTTKVITMEIPDEIVESQPLSRLDGNHRLSALSHIMEEEKNSGTPNSQLSMIVPFSILIQTLNDESDKYESAFFYLINSKAKALTTEENLKSIFSNTGFTSSEKGQLLDINNSQMSVVEKYIELFQKNDFKFVEEIFYNEKYTLSLQLSNLIKISDFSKIISTIQYINALYINKEFDSCLLKGNIFKSFIELKVEDLQNKTNSFDVFRKWIKTNDLSNVKDVSAEKLIAIFNDIHHKREYKVFVAMPYISFKRVNDFNKLFKEVLDEISKKEDVKLVLIPIMRFRGNSQRIDSRLIKCIKECDIFIADLTNSNENVIFEVGLAEGNEKPILLIKADLDTTLLPFENADLDYQNNVPFDMDKLQWIPYSSSGYYNDIKSIMRNNIPEILKELYLEK